MLRRPFGGQHTWFIRSKCTSISARIRNQLIKPKSWLGWSHLTVGIRNVLEVELENSKVRHIPSTYLFPDSHHPSSSSCINLKSIALISRVPSPTMSLRPSDRGASVWTRTRTGRPYYSTVTGSKPFDRRIWSSCPIELHASLAASLCLRGNLATQLKHRSDNNFPCTRLVSNLTKADQTDKLLHGAPLGSENNVCSKFCSQEVCRQSSLYLRS